MFSEIGGREIEIFTQMSLSGTNFPCDKVIELLKYLDVLFRSATKQIRKRFRLTGSLKMSFVCTHGDKIAFINKWSRKNS